MSDYPDTPITREEQYLAAGLDGGDLPDPITREEKYLHEIATKMQGGGSSITVEPLIVTQNGTTTAPSGKAYSPVTVDVPGVTGLTLLGVYDANNPPATALISTPLAATNGGKALVAVDQDGAKYGFFERTVNTQDRKVIFKRGSGETIILDVLNGTIEGATSVTVYQTTLVYPD